MAMRLSVIIPAFNEEAVIGRTLNSVIDYLEGHFLGNYEIIVVNDGSSDNTVELVESTGQSTVKIINLEKNQGKGAAVKQGVLKSQGELILFMDADNSTKINELDRFLPAIEQGNDLVIGSRALKNSTIILKQVWYKTLLGKLGNKFIQLIVYSGIKDTQCGFKLFNQKVGNLFNQMTLNDWGFDFELLFLAKKNQLQVKELPVVWQNRWPSKVKPIDYLKTFIDIFKIHFNNLFGKYE